MPSDAERTEMPTRAVHPIESDWGYATAVAVGSPHAALTAGHVLYSAESRSWTTTVTWKGESSEIVTRGWRYLSSYAGLVNQHGADTPEAFAKDIATIFSYENFVGEGAYATYLDDGGTWLESGREKVLSGFPALNRLNPEDRSIHLTGPFFSAFERENGAYYGRDGVYMGSGGSGGGLWVRDDTESWRLAAVYVSGYHSESGSVGSIGVVAFDSENRVLIEEAINLGKPSAPTLSNFPTEIVFPNENGGTPVFPFGGKPLPTVEWRLRREGAESEILNSSYYGVDENRTWLILDSRDYFLGAKVKLVLTNSSGAFETDWVPVSYRNWGLPQLHDVPSVVSFQEGESGILEVEVESYPPITAFNWTVSSTADFSRYDVVHLRNGIGSENENKLIIDSASLYWSGVYFRLSVRNSLGTVYSEPIRFEVKGPSLDGNVVANSGTHLESGKPSLFRFEFDEPEAIQSSAISVIWEYKSPWSDTWNASGVPDGDVVRNRTEMTITPSTQNWDGYAIRVKAVRSYQVFGSTEKKEETSYSAPLRLSQYGVPTISAIRTLVADGKQLSFNYATASAVEVEWQILDESASVWRPIPQWWAESSVDEGTSHLVLPEGISGSIRAVLRSPDFAPLTTEVFRVDVALAGSQRILMEIPGGYVHDQRLTVGGDWMLVGSRLDYNTKGNTAFTSFRWEQGRWQKMPGLLQAPEAWGKVGFGSSTKIDGNRLYLAVSYLANEGGVLAGRVRKYRPDEGGQWILEEEFFPPPDTDVDAARIEFGNGIFVTEHFMVIRARVSGAPAPYPLGYLYVRPDRESPFVYHSRIDADSPIASCFAGQNNTFRATEVQGFLFLSRDGPFGFHGGLFEVTEDGIEDVDCGGLDFFPSVVHGDLLFGMSSASNPVFYRARWDPENGLTDKWWYGVQVGGYCEGELATVYPEAQESAGGGSKRAVLYTISPEDGSLSAPLYYESRNPSELDRFGYAVKVIPSGFAVLSSRLDGMLQIDVIAQDQSGEGASIESIQERVWLRARPNPDDATMQLDFRVRQGSPLSTRPQILWSTNLLDWRQIDQSTVEVVDPDFDGDGVIELHRAEFPLPNGDSPLYFRLEEP